jgi:lambda repressor-like predicted transcriptional regulator
MCFLSAVKNSSSSSGFTIGFLLKANLGLRSGAGGSILSKLGDVNCFLRSFSKVREDWMIAQKMVSGLYESSKIADRIKDAAVASGISLNALFAKAKVGRNTIANLQVSLPKVDKVGKIADALDCSVDYLLGRTDDPVLHKKEGDAE